MVVGPTKDLKHTSARHTHDQYQAKWDKWDNDQFVDQACADLDSDDEGDNKKGHASNNKKKAASGEWGTGTKVLAAGVWLALCFWAAFKFG
mmetsp:Transcript_13102/g.15824  ORF Transcript_13102/g.15824 Transcript_13102/m.15824 type:complete len:91 (-) Transcript_13102:623-895(-)|eukprot:CAMPEP_0197851952 /NCGR_PEP_ID=MMETSP1438-20131217/19291_1 /TAXON_ID=1461541 /ORGANISM="Pterosperma sp., Strain CCMP1384" /LENGTH=90 /DNA_ID=CAMNT_0043465761 /DNA_START=222 /DNA_END=494 /DNA_ORIENTATION=-